MTRRHAKQRGFTLVSAIFLLVVLASLGAYMVTLSGVQQVTTSQSVQAARAYFAAKAGLEWGIHWATAPGADAGDPDLRQCAASTGPFTLTGSGFEGVSVTVTCTDVAYNGNDYYRTFNLTSTATYGSTGMPDYVERKLQAIVCQSDNATTLRC